MKTLATHDVSNDMSYPLGLCAQDFHDANDRKERQGANRGRGKEEEKKDFAAFEGRKLAGHVFISADRNWPC